MTKEHSDEEPGIVAVEYIDEGRTAQLDIRQVGGDVLRFTVPTRPLVASTVTSEHQPGEPEVQGPNSVPTGSRYDTSTENYADGSPNIPEPQWLQDEGIRMTRERGE
jgi:hypothetical protein